MQPRLRTRGGSPGHPDAVPDPVPNSVPRPAADPAPDPVLERDAADLHAALSELVRVYQFRDRNSICCHGISVTQCYALEAVIQRGSITMNELAALLWLDKSTTSRVVDGLEAAGHLRRLPNPGDGRSVLLEPTGQGCNINARITHDLLQEEKALLRDLDPEVRQITARLIARLARAASERAQRVRGCGTSSLE